MPIARSSEPVPPLPRPEGIDDFVGQWVAVKNGEIVAAAKTSRDLVYKVHKLGERGRDAVVEYVSPPKTSFVVGVG